MVAGHYITADQAIDRLAVEPARFRFLEMQCRDFLSPSKVEFSRRYSSTDLRVLGEANRLLAQGLQTTEVKLRLGRMLANPAKQTPSIASATGGVSSRLITVASGKGGVGKSSIALSLSVEFAVSGLRTIILDADLGVANLHLMAGVHADRTLKDVITGECRIEEVALQLPCGLRIVPGSSGIYELANLPAYNRHVLVSEFRKLEDRYDVIVIDAAAGVAASVVDFAACSDFLLVVTTPEATSVTDAYALIKLSLQRNPACRVGLVANRVRSAREGNSTIRRISDCARRFLSHSVLPLGCIWEDSHVRRAVNERVPFSLLFPDSRASGSIRRLARELREKVVAAPTRRTDGSDAGMKNQSLPAAAHNG